MKFIIANITYEGILKLVLLFQTLQLIAQRPIASIYEKTKKYLLIKVHGNMCTQPSPREPAHVSKPKRKNTSRRQKRMGNTREPSLWEWTKGCLISFLPPFAWHEQWPRAITSVEVQRMMEFHYLPQNCTSSGREAETKLFKFQQIDAKNVKNVQDVIHVPSPWILKGKKLRTCGLEGIKGSPVEPPKVD